MKKVTQQSQRHEMLKAPKYEIVKFFPMDGALECAHRYEKLCDSKTRSIANIGSFIHFRMHSFSLY